MHNWKKVEAGIFHAFHHGWISALSDYLNAGSLPPDYYALPEQIAAGFGPDVLTLQTLPPASPSAGGTMSAAPATRFIAETATEFYRRRKARLLRPCQWRSHGGCPKSSPVNNHARRFRAFVNKACELLEHRVHLLLIDPFPPSAASRNSRRHLG
jgi:hypothetical protein